MTGRAGVDLGLTDEEKRFLLKTARETIARKLEGEEPAIPEAITPRLQEKRGAFVTLNKGGKLRGCIGYIEPAYPLLQTVVEMAEAAAFNDPRFPPLTKDELPAIEIEISVLTPLERARDINQIQVGTHGILIRKGGFQGLLLPQVAVEYNWDRETFLKHTCLKAGLPESCWQDPDTEIWIFSADIFSEREFQTP